MDPRKTQYPQSSDGRLEYPMPAPHFQIFNVGEVMYQGDGVTGASIDYRKVKIQPSEQRYLDFTLRLHEGWEWAYGGKLFGLGGGTATSGCLPKSSDGWSARFLFHPSGRLLLYNYSQNRTSRCGDAILVPEVELPVNRDVRLTMRIKINEPGIPNGEAEVWVDGVSKLRVDSILWRGDVPHTQANIDRFMHETFYGGCDKSYCGPTEVTKAYFSPIKLQHCQPDFSVPYPRCNSRTSR